jgi:hypothetical protein
MWLDTNTLSVFAILKDLCCEIELRRHPPNFRFLRTETSVLLAWVLALIRLFDFQLHYTTLDMEYATI